MMIPKDWERYALGKITETITSGSRDWAQYYSDVGSKFIRMTNLPRDGIYLKLDDLKYVDVKSDSSDGQRTSLNPGDILISITAELGKIGWVPDNLGEAFINQHTALVRLKSKFTDPKFVAYLLSSKEMNHKINRLNDSGAKAGLNLSTIRAIPLSLPPLPEQRKIAAILSTWDKAISTTERLIDNSKQQKKALMQQLLTGKKRLLDDSGKPFEGEWQVYALNKIAEVIVSPVDKKTEDGELSVELCNYTDVYYNHHITRKIQFMKATATKSEIAKYTLKKGDVIITKDSETPGDIAVPALVAEDLQGVVCGYHLAIIRPKHHIVDGAFLNYLFSMQKTRYYFFTLATGATRFGLSVGGINKAHFSIPDIKEQQKIATILTTADQEIERLKDSLLALKQEKKALMQQMLTGKRRVNVDEKAVV